MSHKRGTKSYHYFVANGKVTIRRGHLQDLIRGSKSIQIVDTLPKNVTDCGNLWENDKTRAKNFVYSLIKIKTEFKVKGRKPEDLKK